MRVGFVPYEPNADICNLDKLSCVEKCHEKICLLKMKSVQFSHSVVSDSCNPMNHSTPGLPVHHQLPEFTQTHAHRIGDAIQPSHPLLSPSPPAPKSLPASGSFPMSQLFAWGGQSIGVSTSASVLPMKTQDWSPSGWTGWISLQSKGFSRASSPTPQFKSINFSALSFLHSPTLTSIHDHWKNHSLDQTDLCWKVMSLLLNMLSRLVITFLPRSKRLNFMAAVTIRSDFGAQKNKVWHCFHCLPIYFPWGDGTRCHDLRTTVVSNSVKLSHAVWGHPRWSGHGGEVWQNVIHWRREWQTTSVFLPWELLNSMRRQNDSVRGSTLIETTHPGQAP